MKLCIIYVLLLWPIGDPQRGREFPGGRDRGDCIIAGNEATSNDDKLRGTCLRREIACEVSNVDEKGWPILRPKP